MWTFLIVCVPYKSDQTNEWKIMEERENENKSYQPIWLKGQLPKCEPKTLV